MKVIFNEKVTPPFNILGFSILVLGLHLKRILSTSFEAFTKCMWKFTCMLDLNCLLWI